MAAFSFTLHPTLLGNASKSAVPFYVMESGSSVKEELSSIHREKVMLPMSTLDQELGSYKLENNLLLKLDVQGLEPEVLEGATITLLNCEVVVMEVSFLDYNKNAPLAHEIIDQMQKLGFVIFDFGTFLRNGNDHSLVQADVVFKKKSPLRKQFNDFTKPFTVFAS